MKQRPTNFTDFTTQIKEHPLYRIESDGTFQTGFLESNMKFLPPEKAAPYVQALRQRLNKTKQIVNDSRYSFFIDRVDGALHIMELNYDAQKDAYSKEPFSIDPTSSGFPHFANFWTMEHERDAAKLKLGKLEDPEIIVRMASDKIAQGLFPIEERLTFGEIDYCQSSLMAEPLKLFEIGSIHREKEKRHKDMKFYKMEWYGIDISTSGYIFYKLNFATGGNLSRANLEKPENFPQELRDIIEKNYRQPLDVVFHSIDKLSGIHPKKITKFIVGPYHNRETVLDEQTDALFQEYESRRKKGEEDPFLLEIAKEKVESVGIRPKAVSFIDRLFNGENKFTSEVPSEILRNSRWLTNFRITQILSQDRDGRYARYPANHVYGLTQIGDVAGYRTIGDE